MLTKPILSLISSATEKPLGRLKPLFDEGLAEAVELYFPHEADMRTLKIDMTDQSDDDMGAAEIAAGLDDRQLNKYVRYVEKYDWPVVGLATFMPEIVSADLNRREQAIGALVNAVRIADKLGVGQVEIVGGRHDEECTRNCSGRDCRLVLSYRDYRKPSGPSDKVEDYPVKLSWLIGAIYEIHRRLSHYELEHPVQLRLEAEPGPLYLLSRRSWIQYVLKETELLRVPGHEDVPFVGFNCDIGHCLIMTGRRDLHPAKVWREIMGGVDEPLKRVGSFHISDHPNHRVHIDHPPTTDPRYALPSDPSQGGGGFDWGIPGYFKPWLDCTMCLCGEKKTTLSLELEAVSYREIVEIGLKSLRTAIDLVRREWDRYNHTLSPECELCPLRPSDIPQPPRKRSPSTAKKRTDGPFTWTKRGSGRGGR